MKVRWRSVYENPLFPWVTLFLLLALMVTQYGGPNAMSRVAAMRAITEGRTLNIDNYRDWTIDWAKAPNGHYYSNKAPGAALLGLPIFAITDFFSLSLAHLNHKIDEKGRAPQPGYFPHVIVMLFLQLVPFGLLVLSIGRWMHSKGISNGAVTFFALASLFGNTAVFYMNSNFGHGISAILFLAAFFNWYRGNYLLTGIFLAWCLLSDYGVAFALPFFLGATLWREWNYRPLTRIAFGAAPGAIVWIAYHIACFGSPFATANQFTNPEQIMTLDHTGLHLWGEYSPLPSFEILGKLLLGPSRGLLFTQPWTLAVFALPFFQRGPLTKGTIAVAAGSLLGLLWMNAGFGGWHGGWSMGPRYLSVAFPAIALAIGLAWRGFPSWMKAVLWIGLGVSLAFRLLVFPFPNMAPDTNLWTYHWELALSPDHRGTIILRYALALLAITAVELWRRARARNRISISANSV